MSCLNMLKSPCSDEPFYKSNVNDFCSSRNRQNLRWKRTKQTSENPPTRQLVISVRRSLSFP